MQKTEDVCTAPDEAVPVKAFVQIKFSIEKIVIQQYKNKIRLLVEKKLVCFLVVGRMGKSLTQSKAEPFTINSDVSRIYIFREREALPLPKTIYITLPSWIMKIKPRFLSRFVRLIAEPVQLIYHALKIRPDIIDGYHLIPKGINSLIAAKLSGSKCIISLIGGIVEIETYSRFKWFLKRLNLFALRETDLITTKGSAVNKYLDEHNILLTKILVYNGSINLVKFHFNPSTPKDIDVLFVGTFRNLKGPDKVLQMLALLKKDFPDIRACFVGEGYLYKYCIDLAQMLALSENVTFAGQSDQTETYFQRSKILVMPSRSEGLPTSMLEAMACGCVPVVSNVGNVRDAANHSVNAFLIKDYSDIKSFTKHIRLLLSDETIRAAMARQGIQTVKEKYSAEQQSKIIDQMIGKLYSTNGGI
jgi:glycosyltransferase involved in cell wall biosynthesis